VNLGIAQKMAGSLRGTKVKDGSIDIRDGQLSFGKDAA
jgi:hypothetical protein